MDFFQLVTAGLGMKKHQGPPGLGAFENVLSAHKPLSKGSGWRSGPF